MSDLIPGFFGADPRLDDLVSHSPALHVGIPRLVEVHAVKPGNSVVKPGFMVSNPGILDHEAGECEMAQILCGVQLAYTRLPRGVLFSPPCPPRQSSPGGRWRLHRRPHSPWVLLVLRVKEVALMGVAATSATTPPSPTLLTSPTLRVLAHLPATPRTGDAVASVMW